MTDRDSLHQLLDHHALERLHAAYADAVNRRAWSEVAALFADDADVEIDTGGPEPIRIESPAALAAFLDGAVARFAFLEFVVLTLHVADPVHEAPDDASARLWMCEVRRDVDTLDWSVAYGLYQDRYRRVDGAWRFASRRYRSITRTGADVFPLPSFSPPDAPPG